MKKIFVAFALVLSLFAVATADEELIGISPKGKNESGYVNLRSAPSVKSKVVGKAQFDWEEYDILLAEPQTVYNEKEKSYWYVVRYDQYQKAHNPPIYIYISAEFTRELETESKSHEIFKQELWNKYKIRIK